MKRRYFKHIVMITLLLFWTIGICNTAMAAKKITEINISVKDRGEDYPTISVNGRNYYVDEIKYDKKGENLKVGTIVRPFIKIVPDNGYEFKNIKRENIHITGTGAENTKFTFSAKEEKVSVTIIYTINGVPDAPDNVEWGDSSPWVAWSDKTNADYYVFSLYKGEQLIEKATQVDRKYNFAKALSKAGVCGNDNVYFSVRAVFNENYSEEIFSECYDDWDMLKEFCDKVYSYEWNWKDTSNSTKKQNTNASFEVVPYPGASL